MKVTVTKNLNVRVGAPRLSADCYQYLAPGSILEVEDKLYKGDVFEGSSDWYRDGAGNYYWAGGVDLSKVEQPFLISSDQAYDYWHLKDFGIEEIHKTGFAGQGVHIALIDSGIVKNHPGFDYNGINLKSYLEGEEGVDDHGHGTLCAGVIKSNGTKVFGVAPEAKLSAIQIYSSKHSVKINLLVKSLQELNADASIVSISLNVPKGIQEKSKNELSEVISSLIKRNVIIVVSHGNPNMISSNFLGSLDSVISVGAIDKNNSFKSYTLNDGKPTVFAPGNLVLTADKNLDYSYQGFTSIATPFVASLIGICKQKNPGLNAEKIIRLIKANSDIISDEPQYLKINPSKLLQNLPQ